MKRDDFLCVKRDDNCYVGSVTVVRVSSVMIMLFLLLGACTSNRKAFRGRSEIYSRSTGDRSFWSFELVLLSQQ